VSARGQLLTAAAAAWGAFYALVALAGGGGFDSHAYWLTRNGIAYGTNPGAHDAYLYSPAFAQAIRPLTLLPWPVFAVVWSLCGAVTYVWLVRTVDRPWRYVLLALCAGDIVYGNVWWLFAIVLAFGLRRPGLWALPLLLKVTPAVGLVWFAARREWRNLVVALAFAAAVFAVSFSLAPHAWLDWFAFLRRPHGAGAVDGAVPPAVRFVAAFALTAFAARTDRKWLLPAALWLAAPVFSINGIAIFAALPVLTGRTQRPRLPAAPRLRVQPLT
jgi:hypothetical protein